MAPLPARPSCSFSTLAHRHMRYRLILGRCTSQRARTCASQRRRLAVDPRKCSLLPALSVTTYLLPTVQRRRRAARDRYLWQPQLRDRHKERRVRRRAHRSSLLPLAPMAGRTRRIAHDRLYQDEDRRFPGARWSFHFTIASAGAALPRCAMVLSFHTRSASP